MVQPLYCAVRQRLGDDIIDYDGFPGIGPQPEEELIGEHEYSPKEAQASGANQAHPQGYENDHEECWLIKLPYGMVTRQGISFPIASEQVPRQFVWYRPVNDSVERD